MLNKQHRILFVINPKSGIGKQKKIELLIEKYLDKQIFSHEITYTQYAGHAKEICETKKNEFEIICLVGGDGTINEGAGSLINSNTALAIIPTGSGNGLARHLKIPMKPEDALKKLNNLSYKNIDACKINEQYFFNVAGIGFDGLIAHKFASFGKRGFSSYLKIVLNEFSKYKENEFNLIIDGKTINTKAFMVSLANSSQFGNNVVISPQACIDDGLINVVVLRKFSIIVAPVIALRLFTKSINNSCFVTNYICKQLEINDLKNIYLHIDGEPSIINFPIKIEVLNRALRVVV
ncbi:MAG: hypothetical protein A2046_14855 [Bacteroidetes bacterium GWA2_30_7]|nr:MAG: hypothetical protein A2046_14855 [Bacteroidetes bacterium GWA2_30_7]